MHVSAVGEIHRGGRNSNKDALIIDPELGLYAVLDGLGSAATGKVAAQIASEVLIAFTRTHAVSGRFTPRELLEFGIDEAAAVVHSTGQQRPGCAGMAAAIAAALFTAPTSLVIGHAGDSRAYLLRGGRLQCLTRDHTVVQEHIDIGELPPKASHWTWIHRVLTRNLGDKLGVKADIREVRLHAGDRVVLCSNGLSGCVSMEAIQHVLGSSHIDQDAAHALVELALSSGKATDNISALVLDARVAGP